MIYDSPRLAAGYAYDRPPVHYHIIEKIKASLRITGRRARALDIGCGAGLSTAANEALAETVVSASSLRGRCSRTAAKLRRARAFWLDGPSGSLSVTAHST